ncbi:MAG TPA: CBS domain-containing protein, partial [Dehalococcoidia bacterium]
MLVREFMTSKVVTITEEETLKTADLRFRQGRFRHLPVVRDGTVVGVVSDRDVRALRDLDVPDLPAVLERRRVRDVMRRPAIVASPQDPLEQAARLMYERKIGCLPVVDEGRLVGIVTTSDVFRAFVQVMGVAEPGTRLELT